MEKIIGLTLVCGLVITFVSTSAIREDIAVIRICNSTDSIDVNILNDFMLNHNFNHLEYQKHQQLSCFLLCIYSEYNWMDRHGGFKIHNIKSWMERAKLPPEETDILVKKCITQEFIDPCTRARHFTECFWTNHQGKLSPHRHGLHSIIQKKDVK